MPLCHYLIVGSLASMLGAAAAAAPPRYVAVELASYPGSPGNYPGFMAAAIGPAGSAVGWSGRDAVYWTPAQTSFFGVQDGFAAAHAINAHGQIAGSFRQGQGYRRASVWTSAGMTDLGTLGGRGSGATAINNAGHVAGWSTTPGGSDNAFIWAGGQMVGLGSLPGLPTSSATSINDAGQVVGVASNDTRSRAFMHQGGVMTNLGVPPWAPDAERIAASDINSGGAVVGTIIDPGTPTSTGRAFLWRDGEWTDLGLLDGHTTAAAAINDHGIIVGGTDGGSGFVFADGVMHNLSDLVIGGFEGRIGGAIDINNEGQVLAQGLWVGPHYSEIRHYVLTPVPSAGAAPMLLIASALWCRRRRREPTRGGIAHGSSRTSTPRILATAAA